MKSSYKNVLIIYIRYVTVEDVSYFCKTFILLNDKINGFIEKSNRNKYLALVPTDQSKGTLKQYKEMWNKVRDPDRSITNNSDDYYKKYMSNLIRMIIYL